MDDNHKTDSFYLPHSVAAAFGNGHSDAVAMNPWRRFNTLVLCSSLFEQATIVPGQFNGVAFVSLVPISVPIMNEKKEEKNSKRSEKIDIRTLSSENM